MSQTKAIMIDLIGKANVPTGKDACQSRFPMTLTSSCMR